MSYSWRQELADLAGVTLSDNSRGFGDVFISVLMAMMDGCGKEEYEGHFDKEERARGHFMCCRRLLGVFAEISEFGGTDPFHLMSLQTPT